MNAPLPSAALRHLRFGWASLCLFVVLGAVLEAMHGFKVDWYLAVGNETRRLLWRLAHAHGTFLGLVHVAYGLCLSRIAAGSARVGSACLYGASIALPAGFLLGGVGAAEGDPGIGIVLVPLGFVLLLVAGGSMVRALRG